MFLTTLQAQEYKTVFDCSSGNAHYIMTRMNLIEKTMSMIEKRGNTATFAITLHGGCVPIISKEFADITSQEDIPYIQKAQESITRLSKEKNVAIVACAMSLDANGIDQKDVLPFVHISENSFIDTISYQNNGYSIMTFQ
jgi:intracellular sulfur oxidation DsrE/DsrF family protein